VAASDDDRTVRNAGLRGTNILGGSMTSPESHDGTAPDEEPERGTVEVFVEVPMGSRNKYEWDFDRGTFVLDRMLFSAVRYPGDYGFIPETLALDGDHLDALVILGEPTFPGCTIRARVLGMLDMTDDKGPDEKLLTVASQDPRWRDLHSLDDVPDHLRQEISHFFATYKDLERKFVEVRGWKGQDEALQVLREARERWPGPVTPQPWPQ
jgi:inorganic pyrophosphatase